MRADPIVLKSTTTSTSFPASTLKAWLKQAAVDVLNKGDLARFNACFPEFEGQHELNDALKNKHKASMVITSTSVMDVDGFRPRRYAGDHLLPRSRYYTLSTDCFGNDHGTLLWELGTYWDSDGGMYWNSVDTVVHHDRLAQSYHDFSEYVNNPALLIDIFKLPTSRAALKRRPKKYKITIPIRITEIDCDNVLDLRLPAAQDWLASQYPPGERFVSEKKKTFPRGATGAMLKAGFQFMIPSLVAPDLGGHGFHGSLGRWLRCEGCYGLVYPSARCDVRVVSNASDVYDFAGWNFVLYNGAPLPTSERHTQLMSPFKWLGGPDLGLMIYGGVSKGKRYWEVLGSEQNQRAYYEYQFAKFLGRAAPPSPTYNPRYGTRLKLPTEEHD